MGGAILLAAELVYDVIARCADAGDKCPSNTELAAITRGRAAFASGCVKLLESGGRIIVERGNNTRVVTIVATGRKTAGTVGVPHWRKREDRPTLDAAATCLLPRRDRRRPEQYLPRPTREFSAIDRDPCPRCGVRADVGCAHRAPAVAWSFEA